MKLLFNDKLKIKSGKKEILTSDNVFDVWQLANRLMMGKIPVLNPSIDDFTGVAGECFADAMSIIYSDKFKRNGKRKHPDVLSLKSEINFELKSATISKKWGEQGIVTCSNINGPVAHHYNNIGDNISIFHVLYDFIYGLPTIVAIFYIPKLDKSDWGEISNKDKDNTNSVGTGFTNLTQSSMDKMKKEYLYAIIDEKRYINKFEKIGCDISFTKRDEIMKKRRREGYDKFRESGGTVGRKVGYRKSKEEFENEYKQEIQMLKEGYSLKKIHKLTSTSINTIRLVKKMFFGMAA